MAGEQEPGQGDAWAQCTAMGHPLVRVQGDYNGLLELST